jgi:hypothetical protein
MYRVIGADGKEYGPVTLEQLKTWVAESRLNAQTRVRAEGSGEWKAASEFPEINGLFGLATAGPELPPLSTTAGPGAPKSQGLAITSFVLGILALLCFWILTGIPAIICGHIAYNRSRRAPAQYGGGGFAIAGLSLGYASILISLVILPAMLLPALSRAKGRAQEINCSNNLKQVGLAFRTWALDHNDQFPFNVSTNSGGTAELNEPDEEGIDKNAAVSFQVLSNELSTTRILVCPADNKTPAPNFADLQDENISYILRSGTNVTDINPEEVLARCPIHNNVLRCDGSVQKVRKERGLRIRER